MWTHIAVFVIGAMFGATAAIFCCAICAVAKEADEEMRDAERTERLRRISGN